MIIQFVIKVQFQTSMVIFEPAFEKEDVGFVTITMKFPLRLQYP